MKSFVETGFLDANNAVQVTDALNSLYIYPFNAIRPECGAVMLQLSSEKEPNKCSKDQVGGVTLSG